VAWKSCRVRRWALYALLAVIWICRGCVYVEPVTAEPSRAELQSVHDALIARFYVATPEQQRQIDVQLDEIDCELLAISQAEMHARTQPMIGGSVVAEIGAQELRSARRPFRIARFFKHSAR